MSRPPDNLILKLASAKEKLLPVIKGLDDKQLQRIICHCNYFKIGRKTSLTEKEKEVYDFLLSHRMCPKTLYEWLRIADAPEHIRKGISQRKIGMKEASSKNFLWKKMISRRNGKEIVAQVRVIIGGLEWKNTNQTI